MALPVEGQKFIIGLYRTIAQSSKPEQNIVISPFSAHATLAAALVGAGGTTKSELAATLGLDENITSAQLADKFESVNAVGQFQAANGIFLGKAFDANPKFNQPSAGVDLDVVDFRQVGEAQVKINTFAEKQTNRKVQDLVDATSLNASSQLVLVNAVSYTAKWEIKFQDQYSTAQPFTLEDGQQQWIMLMRNMFKYAYAESPELGGAQLVELQFEGGETSMVVILPGKNGGLRGLEVRLTPPNLDAALKRLSPSEKHLDVFLPKFKVTTAYDLTETLKAMGVKTAFTDQADFSGISSTGPLNVSSSLQKVFFGINEDGTDENPGAREPFRGMPKMGFHDPEANLSFRADRPFLYLIRHAASKAVLLMGRVSDPSVD